MGRKAKTKDDENYWCFSKNRARYPDLPPTYKDRWQTRLRRLASFHNMTENQQRFLSMHICLSNGRESYVTLDRVAKDMEVSLDCASFLDKWAQDCDFIRCEGKGPYRRVLMMFVEDM